MHSPAYHYSKDDFSTVGIIQGEGHATPQNTLLCRPRHKIQSTTKHNFRVSSYAPTRPNILPVIKRLAACFDPSHQSLAPPVHVFYRHPLTHHALLFPILSVVDAILHNI